MCWALAKSGIKDFRNFGRHFPCATDLQKSLQHVRACAAGDGAICSKNRNFVPYHGNSPNTRNGAPLRSPSPIMAPVNTKYFTSYLIFLTLYVANYLCIRPWLKKDWICQWRLSGKHWCTFLTFRGFLDLFLQWVLAGSRFHSIFIFGFSMSIWFCLYPRTVETMMLD